MEVKLRSLPESLSKIKTTFPGLYGRNRWGLGLVLAGVGITASLLASCAPAASTSSEIPHQSQTPIVTPDVQSTATTTVPGCNPGEFMKKNDFREIDIGGGPEDINPDIERIKKINELLNRCKLPPLEETKWYRDMMLKYSPFTPVKPTFEPPTPTNTPVTSAPIPTRPSRESATPIPTVDKIPLDQLPTKIDNLKTTITSYATPFNPRLSPEGFKQKVDNVVFITNKIQEAFKNGSTEEGRKWLVELKSAIFHMGDPLQSKDVPPEIKKAHDPKDKYIKDDSVDPRLMEPYLVPVDLLVITDRNY